MTLPEILFDPSHFSFRCKPLLVMGKAMQWYGLRRGHDYDWLVSRHDFFWLQSTFAACSFTSNCGNVGVRVGPHEFSATLYSLSYGLLAKEAGEQQDYRIIRLELLCFLVTMRIMHEPENAQAKHDLLLLLYHLEVLPQLLHNRAPQRLPTTAPESEQLP